MFLIIKRIILFLISNSRYINCFWIGAAVLSVLLALLVWKAGTRAG